MNQGFWTSLPRPFFVLAPMANVTDAAFRRVIASYGKPDVFWTEFVSCDGLFSTGRETALMDFWFDESEHPIVAQIFGSNPQTFFQTAQLIKDLGFDGIDINMGCPDRSVEKQGAGACMIKTPDKAREVIRAAKQGGGGLPVSVKTRIGYTKDTLEEWLPVLLEEEVAAVTIHARTRKEMSLVPARWEMVKKAVDIRNRLGSKTLIIGNGDLKSLADAQAKVEETGADGAMLGRAIFGNPWLFSKTHPLESISLRQKLEALREHVQLYTSLYGPRKKFDIMKKHFKAYVSGFDGAKDLRIQLMECRKAEDVYPIINNYIESL